MITPDRPYAACGACNCVPGYCAQAEYLRQAEVDALIRNTFATVATGGNSLFPDLSGNMGPPVPPLKNRKQRRMEDRLKRRGPPAKRRR